MQAHIPESGDRGPVILLEMHAEKSELLQSTFDELFETAGSKLHTKGPNGQYEAHITIAWTNSISAEEKKK